VIGIDLIPFASAKPISRDPGAVAMLLAGASSQQAQHAAQHADAQSAVDTQLAQAALEENLTHHLPVPPPTMFPLDEAAAATAGSSVFPLSTWHADLPATGLPSLERWTAQGLAPNQRTRIEHIISVYSLGFHQVRSILSRTMHLYIARVFVLFLHMFFYFLTLVVSAFATLFLCLLVQLIRAVRAGMVDPSVTVAAIWKMFVFLLNDCMPDGSVYSMRVAQMERDQAARARELMAQREAELARLLALEAQLQAQVQRLDQALRCVQSNRQDAEDARYVGPRARGDDATGVAALLSSALLCRFCSLTLVVSLAWFVLW